MQINFCSYCIVPYVRGVAREVATSDDIAAEARSHVEAGRQGDHAAGENVNPTGATFTASRGSRMSFGPWMPRAIERFCFATSRTEGFTDEVIGLFATLPSLMPALHLPVQSGSKPHPSRIE